MRTVGVTLLTVLLGSAFGLKIKAEDYKPKADKKKNQVVESIPDTTAAEITGPPAPVFYAVIMGRLAYRHQVSLWLNSLRVVGNWTGEAVIVTDKPECLAETLKEAKMLGEKLFSEDHVDIYGPTPETKGNLHIVKRPAADSINKMKLEKARAWHNIAVAKIPHVVSSVIYTDEDVVIGKDVSNFVTMIKETEKLKHTVAVFRDLGTTYGELHTGVVVMYAGKRTQKCLQAWGWNLVKADIGAPKAKLKQTETAGAENLNEALSMGPDQQALGRTEECKEDDGIKVLPKDFFWLPMPGGMEREKVREFVHFTNTGRMKTIPQELIKAYLTKIGIPEHIDPMGTVQSKQCAVPEGGSLQKLKKDPTDYH